MRPAVARLAEGAIEIRWASEVRIPGVDAGKVDMLPTERRDVLQQSIRNISTRSLQLCDWTVEIDCIPLDDRTDDEVETRGAGQFLEYRRRHHGPRRDRRREMEQIVPMIGIKLALIGAPMWFDSAGYASAD